MTAPRITWCLLAFLFFCCCSLTGCAVRNRQQAGRDLTYECTITISPSAELAGAKLPSVPGLEILSGGR